MNRGEVWWAEAGGKRRPVVVLTRSEVIDVRESVTVAEVTTRIRGLAVEVPIGDDQMPLSRPSVVNCDGLHTIRISALAGRVGVLNEATIQQICRSVAYALGC